MTYVELLHALEQRLGYQHLPLNPHAAGIKDLFESTPVHHELMQRLVQALYRCNGCRLIVDAVTKEACFEAIGSTRQEMLKTATTDVEAYRLMDDVCRALIEIFEVIQEPAAVEEKRTADVLPFTSRPRRNTR
ncbi:MAG TPA: hypothetical protein VJS66_09030 [Burkholderiales bacterium]|nr:hypothetical protein [Burkholderiales bacterium]